MAVATVITRGTVYASSGALQNAQTLDTQRCLQQLTKLKITSILSLAFLLFLFEVVGYSKIGDLVLEPRRWLSGLTHEGRGSREDRDEGAPFTYDDP